MNNKTLDILAVSRGKGRGHAVRDLEISNELENMAPGINIQFVSYAVGAQTFRDARRSVVDLHLPVKNSFPETLVRVSREISMRKPRLVVAQEEFAALTASRLQGIQSVFTTHWFPRQDHPFARSLFHADGLICMEREGAYPKFDGLPYEVRYTGPIVKRMNVTQSCRSIIRSEYRIEDDETMVLVIPGSTGEVEEPSIALISAAFRTLKNKRAKLFWIDSNQELTHKWSLREPFLNVIPRISDPERLMLACDVAITKGTYNTTKELEWLGVPQIALSWERNPVDDHFSKTTRGCIWISARQSSSDELAKAIRCALQMPRGPIMQGSDGARAAAAAIMAYLEPTMVLKMLR